MNEVQRRSVLRAGIWATPVVAIAAAAPAAAASTGSFGLLWVPTSGDLVSQIPGAIPQLGGVLINVQNNTGRDFTGSLRLIIAGEPGGAGVSGSSSAAGWSSVSYTYATRTLIMNWSGTVASGVLLPSVVYSLTAHTTGSGTSFVTATLIGDTIETTSAVFTATYQYTPA